METIDGHVIGYSVVMEAHKPNQATVHSPKPAFRAIKTFTGPDCKQRAIAYSELLSEAYFLGVVDQGGKRLETKAS